MPASLRNRLWWWWSAVGAAALAGLCLRIVAAQGGLWTDEAWSVIYAAEARDPLGVFLRINHDNNHHLYSLWLQAIGFGAPPWLARLPAIVASTASVIVAALLVRDRSRLAGVIAAVLFAIAPPLVTFGSEARGYSLMVLAALLMLMIVTRAVERGTGRWMPLVAALLAMLGMLSHMTMAAVVALATLWVYLDRRVAVGPDVALRTTVRLMGPALVATAAVVVFVFAVAAASPTGMQLGGYTPFGWDGYVGALDTLSGWTIGTSGFASWAGPSVVAAAALALAFQPPPWAGSRGRLYALLILGVPLGAALLHPGNAQFSRYYLCSALGLLLLASEWIAHALAKRGTVRVLAGAATVAIVSACAWHDSDLIQAGRGHPDAAFRIIAAQSPHGARVALDPIRFEGMLRVAATNAGYPLTFVRGCEPADFLVVGRVDSGPVPKTLARCGVKLRALGSGMGTPLSGDSWIVYGSDHLQSAGVPDSAPAPRRADARLPGRAGVAQG